MQDSPSAYWRLGEAAGSTTATDSSGTGLSGTYSAGVVTGVDGALPADTDTAAEFPAGESMVASPADFGNSDFSFETWVRASASVSSDVTIAGHWLSLHNEEIQCPDEPDGPPAVEGWRVIISGDPASAGQVEAEVQNAPTDSVTCESGPNALIAFSGATVDDGDWHHVVVTVDRANAVTVYVDGEGTTTPGGTPESLSVPFGHFALGGEGDAGQSVSLDEAALYTHVLSSDSVANHYAASTADAHLFPIIGEAGNFGMNLVWDSCCKLTGVESSIETPDDPFELAPGVIGVMRVTAERADMRVEGPRPVGLIQAGFGQTDMPSGVVATGCDQWPTLTNYVEIKPYSGADTSYRCIQFQTVPEDGSNWVYKLLHNTGGTVWTAFLDGHPEVSVDLGEFFDEATYIGAGGEFASGQAPFIGTYGKSSACFGCDGGVRWSRTSDSWNGGLDNSTWHTIKEARWINSGDPHWQVGNPADGPFTISHPFQAP